MKAKLCFGIGLLFYAAISTAAEYQDCFRENSSGSTFISSGLSNILDEEEKKDPLVAIDERNGTAYWLDQKSGQLTIKDEQTPGRELTLFDDVDRPFSASDMLIEGGVLYLRNVYTNQIHKISLTDLRGKPKAQSTTDAYIASRLIRGGINLTGGTVQSDALNSAFPLRVGDQVFAFTVDRTAGVLVAKGEMGDQAKTYALLISPGTRLASAIPLGIRETNDGSKRRKDLYIQVDDVRLDSSKGLIVTSRIFRYDWSVPTPSVGLRPRLAHYLQQGTNSWFCYSLNVPIRAGLGRYTLPFMLVRSGRVGPIRYQDNGVTLGEPDLANKLRFKLINVPRSDVPSNLVSAAQPRENPVLDKENPYWKAGLPFMNVEWSVTGKPTYPSGYRRPPNQLIPSKQTAVPYALGCYDEPSAFKEKHEAGKHLEGNVDSGYCNPKMVAGIDCSGFVARVWDVDRKERPFGTVNLDSRFVNRVRDLFTIETGDAFNQPLSHIRLVGAIVDVGTMSFVNIQESSGTCGGVCHRLLPLSMFERFVLVRKK